MDSNRIMPDGATRAALLATGVLLAFTLVACGSEESSEVDTAALEREADVEILNEVLERQRAAVDALGRARPRMRGSSQALATRFRTAEQEHAVAVLAILRRLDGEEVAGDEEIEWDGPRTKAGDLRFLYELEAATLEHELGAIGRLESGAARTLLATTVANRAQHLVLLRRGLGARPTEWVPSAFEDGAAPAP